VQSLAEQPVEQFEPTADAVGKSNLASRMLNPAPGARLVTSEMDLLEVLVRQGVLGEDSENKVRDLVHRTGASVNSVLDRLGILPQRDWVEICSAASGLASVQTGDLPETLEAHPRVDLRFCKKKHVLFLGYGDGSSIFAIANPWDDYVLRSTTIASGGRAQFRLMGERDIEAALSRLENLLDEQSGVSAYGTSGNDTSDAQYLLEIANDGPTIKLVDTIIAQAIERRATDIHLEPFERSARIRFRVDGVLQEGDPVASTLYPGVVSRLKILASMDIAERRLPQDGRIHHRSHGRAFDIRVASLPTIHGESLVLRMLPHDGDKSSIDALNMPSNVRGLVDHALTLSNGLIIVTGPTGSGKTTTLSALLNHLNQTGRKILTVENPVEIRIAGAIQIEVQPDIGLDFANTLRTFLRHDPDILMVGEIRDAETARVAIQAALTGHLVLSTLHTNSAAEAATRLTDMGVEPFLLKSVLRAAIAQRLVRRICDHEEGSLDPTACVRCSGGGYYGRQAVFEALDSGQLAEVLDGNHVQAQTMEDHGALLVSKGLTDAREIARVLNASPKGQANA